MKAIIKTSKTFSRALPCDLCGKDIPAGDFTHHVETRRGMAWACKACTEKLMRKEKRRIKKEEAVKNDTQP